MADNKAQCKSQANNESRVVEAPRYGCSLSGVYEATVGLKKAVPILHSGSGCGMSQIHGTGMAGGFNSTGDYGSTNVPCSSLVEEHVIFGGEDKLRKLVDSSIQMFNSDLFVVISGCVPSLIGDDVDAIVGEFRDKVPLIHVNAPGFSGNSFHGYELFFEALADQLLTPKRKRKKLVNIFGIVPFQHLFWKGELKTIKQILKDIGVEANVIFTEFDTLETLEKIPAAAYNLVLSPWVGHRAAKKLEEKFGTPFVSFPGPPVGPIQTTKFLRKVADLLDLPTKKVEDYIFKQERESYDLLEFGADAIIVYDPNSYFAVAADTNTAINITKYLTDEISALPEVIIITDDPPVEFRDQIIKEFESKEISFSPEIIFEKDTYKIQKHLENRSFSTLFASSIESAFANKLNKLHLTVTFPSYNRLVLGDNYVGYFGGTHFIENAKSIKLGPL